MRRSTRSSGFWSWRTGVSACSGGEWSRRPHGWRVSTPARRPRRGTAPRPRARRWRRWKGEIAGVKVVHPTCSGPLVVTLLARELCRLLAEKFDALGDVVEQLLPFAVFIFDREQRLDV